MSDDIPSYLPLIFALKDLCIRFYPNKVDSPAAFSASVGLMRGETSLPAIDNEVVESLLKKGPHNAPVASPMDEMMRAAEFAGWPEDAFQAVLGVLAFGPGDIERASTCALYSLQLNKDGRLARQLLYLLSEKADPRIPFADIETEFKDVLTKLGGKIS